jgi:HlyD family secretion protein
MDSTRLFRKVALDRISSPEQLDQLLQVTAPRNWLALIAVICLLGVAISWAFTGQLLTTVSGQGVLVHGTIAAIAVPAGFGPNEKPVARPDVDTLAVLVYVPVAQADEIRPQMEAQIRPRAVPREEHGFIRGRVVAIADDPATEAALMERLENAALAKAIGAAGPVIEIRVEMERDPGTPSGFRWSSGHGAPIRLHRGTLCGADIVIRADPPISLVFPFFRQRPGVS